MRNTLSMTDGQLAELRRAMDNDDGHERLAYLFCNLAVSSGETRLIVSGIQAAESEFTVSSSAKHVTVTSHSYVRAMAKADRESKSLVLVHSHPSGMARFSTQDNAQEPDFFRTAYLRAPHGVHASIVFVGKEPDNMIGRVWDADGSTRPIARIRIVGGSRFRVFENGLENEIIAPWADRQVRAFGAEAQKLLGELHIGIAGAGGTGSAIAEQLIRIGIGEITVVDDQAVEDTNVTRIYGSRLSDVDTPKVTLPERLAADIGLGTVVHATNGSICDEATAKKLRDCDIVFGCTDDFLGRKILNRLALWYYIPVIDTAVVIDSNNGIIKEITGRVTILSPGATCLTCRGRISQAKLEAQTLKNDNPELYKKRVKQRYAAEIDQTDPSIIMFTTGIAARAVSELMHMLTGFMGESRKTTEVLERFHDTDIGKNAVPARDGCICGLAGKWGKADEPNFLGMLF